MRNFSSPTRLRLPLLSTIKYGAALTWLAVIGALYFIAYRSGLTLVELFESISDFLSTHTLAPLLYIALYLIQPYLFLPSTIFTILAGALFGFWLGYFYTLIGAMLSAALVYWTGRYLTVNELPGFITRFALPLHREPFLTMLFMRLAYFPFDVVNLSAGLLKMRVRPFMAATALGILPGVATLTALGAAIDVPTLLRDGFTMSAINPYSLVASVVLFLITLVVTLVVRRKITPIHTN